MSTRPSRCDRKGAWRPGDLGPSLEPFGRGAQKNHEGFARRAHSFRRYLAPSGRPGRYDQQLVQLQDALSKGINAGDSDATEAIRDLVETVTVFRDPSRPSGVTVEIAGRLTALLNEPVFPTNVRGVWGKLVAREGLEPPTPGL